MEQLHLKTLQNGGTYSLSQLKPFDTVVPLSNFDSENCSIHHTPNEASGMCRVAKFMISLRRQDLTDGDGWLLEVVLLPTN